jgi:hypothetical protein
VQRRQTTPHPELIDKKSANAESDGVGEQKPLSDEGILAVSDVEFLAQHRR